MLLALMWFYAGNGRGEKDMVILPYKDRLALFSRYLQQLVMESLGKEKDLDGNVVHQGIAVYGNKGSTDQHAYVQQLRDGVLNFFVTFIEVRKDRTAPRIEVEEGITSGDYLHGFLRGTRAALYENGRESITISIPEVNAFQVGALVIQPWGLPWKLLRIRNRASTPTINPASKLEKKRRRVCSNCSIASVPLFLPHQGKRRMKSRVRSRDPEDVYDLLRHMAANDPARATVAADRPSLESFFVR